MDRKRHENPLMTVLLFAVMILGFAVTAIDPYGLLASHGGKINTAVLINANPALFVIGLCMVIAGLMIRTVAIIELKRNFSGLVRIREGHTLTKTGIYRYVRHPAYLGAIIVFAGFPVLLSSPLGLLVMLLLVPILVHRGKVEEKMLLEHFGSEYEEYMRHSKRLIPFLY